jgi:hypothetical protein
VEKSDQCLFDAAPMVTLYAVAERKNMKLDKRYKEFLRELKKTPRHWYTNMSGGIRIKIVLNGCIEFACPVSIRKSRPPYQFIEAGDESGLTRPEILHYANIADREPGITLAERNAMLVACGLPKEKVQP